MKACVFLALAIWPVHGFAQSKTLNRGLAADRDHVAAIGGGQLEDSGPGPGARAKRSGAIPVPH